VELNIGGAMVFAIEKLFKVIVKITTGVHGGQDDLILSVKLIRIAPETSSF
jgi:hypothetical protein